MLGAFVFEVCVQYDPVVFQRNKNMLHEHLQIFGPVALVPIPLVPDGYPELRFPDPPVEVHETQIPNSRRLPTPLPVVKRLGDSGGFRTELVQAIEFEVIQ